MLQPLALVVFAVALTLHLYTDLARLKDEKSLKGELRGAAENGS